MAAKLARLIYRLLRDGMTYVDQGAAFYEAQHRQIKQLQRKAAKLGYKVTYFRRPKKKSRRRLAIPLCETSNRSS